jgi:hypothetical protein
MNKQTMWKILEAERNKDNADLEREKIKLINELKKYKKEDIVKPKVKKLNFFKKLKILLWGN